MRIETTLKGLKALHNNPSLNIGWIEQTDVHNACVLLSEMRAIQRECLTALTALMDDTTAFNALSPCAQNNVRGALSRAKAFLDEMEGTA
jgi:hypothetical protein